MKIIQLVTLLTVLSVAFPSAALAAPGVSQFVTIQGKVTNTDGTNVTDGAYDFVFNAYHGATSAAASQFTESWTNAALYTSTMTVAPGLNGESLTYSSNTNEASLKVGQVLWNVTRQEPVTIVSVNNGTNVVGISPTRQAWQTTDTITNRIYVKDGVFRVALNSLNQNWGTVDFTQDTILVGINFNGDGEMKPRIQFASVPYAQAASLLDGIDSNGFLRTNANSELLTSNTLTTTGYLDVNGDISIADTNIALDGANSNLEVTGNFTINTDDLAVVKATGNVAIGSANPGTDKLHVTGNIVATTSIAATTSLAAGTTVTAGSTATYDPILISPVARGANAYTGTVTSDDLTAARTWTLPNATGTIALTSDIPAAGAPADATYITQTANAGLSNEQALSSLATGIVQVTTSTGVLSSVTTSAGISNLLSDETGSGHLVFDTSPTIDTSLVAGTVSFDLLNTTATTINFAGAATTLNMGAGGALTRTINIGTGTGVDTIHIGDGGTGADVITIGSANAGNVSVTSNATLTLHGEANSIIDFPNFDVATTGNITTSGDLLVNGDDISADGTLGITGATGVTVTSTANNITLNSAGTIELQDATNVTGAFTGSTTLTAGLVATYDPITISPVARGTNAYTGTITSADLTAARTWTLPDASVTLMSNPMTAAGDILYGGASGTPTRLAGAGTNGHVLKYNTATNVPYWAADTDTDTTYSAGNDIDFSGTQIDLEPQLDYVTTISRASSDLTLQTTTSGNIILNPAGRVGIGTTSPSSDLELATASTANTRGLTLTQAGATYAAKAVFRKSEGTLAAPTTVASGDYVGAFGFMPYTTTSGFIQTAGFGTYVNGTVTGTAAPTDMYFYTGSVDNTTPLSNGAVRLYLESGGDVGIGTTNPAAKLEVNGNFNFSAGGDRVLQIANNALATGHSLTIYPGDSTAAGAVGGNLVLRGSDATGAVGSIGGDVMLYGGIGEGSDGDIILGHNGTAAIGYVGIGTNAPDSHLEISGAGNQQLKITSTDHNDVSLVLERAVNGYTSYGFKDSGGNLYIQSSTDQGSNWTSRLTILDTSGYVGVGGVTPTSEFHVGGATPLVTIGDAGAEDAGILFDGNAQDYHIGLDDTNDTLEIGLGSALGTSSFMNFTSAGYVGIGTTDPAYKLSIKGSASDNAQIQFDTSAYGGHIYTVAGASAGNLFLRPASGNVSLWSGTTATNLNLHNGTSYNTTINSNGDSYFNGGDVGIGTNNPGALLDVNGMLYAGDIQTRDDAIEINQHGTGNRFAYIDFHGDDTYTDYGFRILRYNTGANTGTDLINRGTGNLSLVTYEAGDINLKTTNTTRMTVTSGGYVGIGVTDPSSPLYVSGSVNQVYPGDPGTMTVKGTGTYGANLGVIAPSSSYVSQLSLGNATNDQGWIMSNRNNYNSEGYALKFYYYNGTAWTAPMALLTNGNVGIGTTVPNQGRLEVKGGVVCVDSNNDDNATVCMAAESDSRLKTNITPIGSALDKIVSLTGVEFDWRVEDPDIVEQYPLITRFADRPHSIGLIAQDVERVFPEALLEEVNGFKQLNYQVLVGPIIQAIKELNDKVDRRTMSHQTEITDLQAQLDALSLKVKDAPLPTPVPTVEPAPTPSDNESVAVLSNRITTLENITTETTASVAGITTELAVTAAESRLTALENIIEAMRRSDEAEMDLSLPIEASTAALASGSATLNPLDIAAALTDVAISPDMISTNFLSVMDQAVMPNLYVSTISPMGESLNIMNGLLTLSTSGQVTIAGNLKVTGLTELAQLTVNEASISGTLSAPVIDELASKSAFLEQYVASLSAELMTLKTQLASPAAEASTAAVATPSARLSYFSQ